MEMVEQVYISLVLKQSRLDWRNRLALIILDNVAEVALKSYADIRGHLNFIWQTIYINQHVDTCKNYKKIVGDLI